MFPIIDKKETGINLRRMLDARDISARDVQEYLNLGCVQSVYRWFDGISMPTIDNLYALSELLQVPIDELVQGNRAPISRKHGTCDYMLQQPECAIERMVSYYEQTTGKKVA